MPYVLLQQVSSNFAQSNAGKTLDHPVALKYLKNHVKTAYFDQLSQAFEDGKAFFWGAKLERGHQIEKMLPEHTLVLFRRGNRVFRIGVITELLVSIELAQYLWGQDTDGTTWAIIYAMSELRDVNLATESINKLIGRSPENHWQGMTAIEGDPAKKVIAFIREQLSVA